MIHENNYYSIYYVLSDVSNYHYHMAHHGNDRNFLCTECPKTYKTNVDLLQHEKVHDKLKDRPKQKKTKGSYSIDLITSLSPCIYVYYILSFL